jgi:proteasome-associated ATPase
MSRRPESAVLEPPVLEKLTAVGDGAPSVDEKFQYVQAIRALSPDVSHKLDRFFLEDAVRMRLGLLEAKAHQAKLKEILEALGATPWFPATYIRPVATPLGDRVIVAHGSSFRVVGLAKEVDPESLQAGDEVYLGNELNVVTCKAPYGMPLCGETAFFERYAEGGRLVLKWRDEEVVVEPAAALQGTELKAGDQVRWDKNVWMAFERIERAAGKRFLLDEVPDIGREAVGGQDANLETLLAALTTTLVAPDKAKTYGLGSRQSILMVGPPGCGKTLMARVAAAHIARISGKRCRFGVVKPSEWEDPYVGMTQQNIRNCFLSLKEAAQDGFAVLFMDEIESVGRIRGSMVGHHSDKFLAALLAEMDGFTDRAGVAIIAATNRKDLIDPALLERLSDVEVLVGRPDLRGARAIFGIHLPEALPYSPNGPKAAATRQEIIDLAVSRFYSPNADSELCTLRFRDGKTRTVSAREVASGRVFAQVCRAARQKAFLRDVRGGDEGVRVEDMQGAVAHALERLATTLTLRNVHAYLTDLPQDIDVVSVDPIARRVPRPHRYLNAGHAG